MEHFIFTTTVISHHIEAFVFRLDLDARSRRKKVGKMKKEWSHYIK